MIRFAKGSTRWVFLTRKHAIKIPTLNSWRLFLHGLLGNMQEATFWTTKDDRLCPVLFALPGGFLSIMARCAPLSADSYENLDVETWASPDDSIAHDFKVPVEDKLSSFGVYDGRIVAVDYGS
ncbi:hypothetical protein EVC12_201 [Rhizobium phage RHph_I42]|nr:hypothetical protein EVC12_201 [Rhizobium phage RHph_I42]